MEKNTIIKRYGADPAQMTRTLLAYAGLAEDIGDRNKHIGLKPNLVTPTPADFGATTHPEIVAGIISYLQENGFRNITIIEGSWVGDKTSEAYEYCGYRTLCETYGVAFVDTQKDTFTERDCAGMRLNICDRVGEIDYMINIPVLKGHCQTKMTCALKNMKGLIPNSEKRKFHTMGLHKPIAHLSQGIHQDFIVVDHICGDPTFEEGGNPLKTYCVMVAKDPVLVDAYACHLLGLRTEEVPYVGMSEALGSGSTDLKNAEVLVLNDEGRVIRRLVGDQDDPYEARFATRRPPLDVAVDIDDCESCSACFAALTAALSRMTEEELKRLPRIAIGQGHRGNTGEYGIGNCCQGFTNCIPGCPPDEEDIFQTLKNTFFC